MQRSLWPAPLKALQVKLGYVHVSSGNFQTGWDWVNSEFRTEWQRVFLLVVHYTSFNTHSYVFQGCSQTFMKKPWTGKWCSKAGWMSSFKSPLKILLHIRNSQQDKIAEMFLKDFPLLLVITRNPSFSHINLLWSRKAWARNSQEGKNQVLWVQWAETDRQTDRHAFLSGTCVIPNKK